MSNRILTKIEDPFLFDLDYLEIHSLIADFDKIKNSKIKYERSIKISISSDYTSNYLTEFLPLFFANKRMNVEIHEKEFGSLNFLSRDITNKFWKNNTDLYLLIPSYKNLNFPKITDKFSLIKKKAQKDALRWISIWKKINKKIIQTTFDPPLYSNLGDVDGVRLGGHLHYIRLVNSFLIEKKPPNVHLIDIENLIFKNKKTKWNDRKIYDLTKQPFSMETIPILSNQIANASKGMFGLAKKVLVTDLDNTIWGGIIGDDGLENIILGSDTVEGESYQNFQEYLKQLTKKGIILCVCSKNNEKISKKVFSKNPNMILKIEDITVFKSNFSDKASNIMEISKILNIGLGSFVFIDDSKFECDQVKKTLPEVMTLKLSEDASESIEILESASPFYFNNISKEDLSRVSNYKKITKINSKIENSKNLESFLKSLKSKVVLEKISKKNCERSSQLIAKTNQFKLNSKIFSSKELIQKNAFCINYKDIHQDYGNIGVVICKIKEGKELIIDNWVMSCRVFSRRIEFFIIEYLLNEALKNQCRYLSFRFMKSEKNLYLQEFLISLGLNIQNQNQSLKVNKDFIKKRIYKYYIKAKVF